MKVEGQTLRHGLSWIYPRPTTSIVVATPHGITFSFVFSYLEECAVLRRLQLNSNYSGYFVPYTSISWDTACNGNDYARNVATPDIDFASLHLYPVVGPGWTQFLQETVCCLMFAFAYVSLCGTPLVYPGPPITHAYRRKLFFSLIFFSFLSVFIPALQQLHLKCSLETAHARFQHFSSSGLSLL